MGPCFALRHVTYGCASVCSSTPDFFASQDFRIKDQFLHLGSVKDIFKRSLTLAAVFPATFQRECMQAEPYTDQMLSYSKSLVRFEATCLCLPLSH